MSGACPGGGAQGPGACPPPLEIEKQKKGHQSKFSAISPIFCYFFSRKYYFLSYFLEKQKKEKKQLKNAFRFWAPPPPYEFLDTRLHVFSFLTHFKHISIE